MISITFKPSKPEGTRVSYVRSLSGITTTMTKHYLDGTTRSLTVFNN